MIGSPTTPAAAIKLDRARVALVVVDVQEAFRSVIAGFDTMVRSIEILLEAASPLGMPIVVTEQYPRGLGATVTELRERLDGAIPLEKTAFSATGASGFDLGRRDQVLLCGIEAHICVWQTAFALRERGMEVQVVVDAVTSRTMENRRIGIARMNGIGVASTSVEMALFELLGHALSREFKVVQRLLKDEAIPEGSQLAREL